MKKKDKNGKHRKLWILLGSVIAVFLALFIGITIYVNIYYPATDDAYQQLESGEGVSVYKEHNYYVFEPDHYNTGIVFYPGGKVEAVAYAPLLKSLANEGYLCVLYEMPFRLAVLNMNAAEGIQERFKIDHWYMAGHSLGGSMGASFISKYIDQYEGLILLGAYSTVDLSDTDLNVLSIYGENDGVLNREKYEKNLKNLPDNFHEFIIPGGNHAYFGSYGYQKKDGAPTITNGEQIEQTVEIIKNYI